MKKREFEEARKLARAILNEVATTVRDTGTVSAGLLAQKIDAVIADMQITMKSFDFAIGFTTCFSLAYLSGGTADDFYRVRRLCRSLDAKYTTGLALIEAGKRISLVAETHAIAENPLGTAQRCEEIQTRLNADFDEVITTAADRMEYDVSRAFVQLHAAVTADLIARGRRLPRVTAFSFAETMPSLRMAARLYGDAERADELRDENRVPHPLFMPRSVRALTV